jgi:hypothetical protein
VGEGNRQAEQQCGKKRGRMGAVLSPIYGLPLLFTPLHGFLHFFLIDWLKIKYPRSVANKKLGAGHTII